jgi:lipopolysaccharide/colanic/teichoic acid biosynthesis glycosyltransferase
MDRFIFSESQGPTLADPLGELPQRSLSGWLKAALDRSVASVGLICTFPIMAAVAVAIRLEGAGPVLFTQLRPGLGGRPFRLYKFRTMRDARGSDGRPLPDGDRLTSLGRFLRRTSLDELPQLWNVLRGELSLVGPRPLLMEYLPRYSPKQARRHLVKPGITGWAQVNGRNALSWEEKFAFDVWYVDHWSLFLDLRILARTAKSVITAHGVSSPGLATMAEFVGSKGETDNG